MIQKLKRWIIGALVVALLPVGVVQAQSELPQEIYLTQAQSRSCTLCSATMMLRSCVYIHGSQLWQQVTENSVGAYAWTSDGMYWNFGYTLEENSFRISQQGCGGITADKLKAVLDTHPEGIVLYCGGSAPHAVFLSDYDGDTFYCADPASGYSGSRIPLEQSLLGARHGSQSNILSAVCAYWYIESHDLEDRSYFMKCREYETQCRIRVRWDGYAMSLPASENGCEQSQKRIPIRCGDYYTAQAIIVNAAGEYWYRVGEDLYISAADAPAVLEEPAVSVTPIEPPDAQQQDVVPLMLFSTIKIP